MNPAQTSYPELYLPTKISSLLKEVPSLPPEPSLPQKPKIPENPGEYDSGGNRGCFAIMVIVSIVIFILIITADKFKFEAMLCSIGVFLGSLFLFKTTTWDKESHEKKKKQYDQAKNQYQFLLEKYEKELESYNQKKRLYDKQKEFLLSKSNIDRYRADIINNYIKNSYKIPIFEACEENDFIKKGASEDFFVEELRTSKKWNVYTEQKVPVGEKFYYPDIIVVVNGIFINIEIDEPYAGNDGTPIHYLDNYFRKTSIDMGRNYYMTSHGWLVIRFAEEQIFLHTEECIRYIADVVNSILEGKINVTVSDEFTREKWNKEQSHKMSYKRFRRTYVPQEYQSNIDKEDFRSYSDIRGEIFSSL